MPTLSSRPRATVLLATTFLCSWLGAAPTITQQPGVVTATSGTPATFAVVATGVGTVRYQWRHLGAYLAGEVGHSLTLPVVKMADAGFYDVVVTDDDGSVDSQAGRLLVSPVGGYPNTLRLDTSFAPLFESPGGSVDRVTVTPRGAIYVGGEFSTIAGQRRNGLARFSADLLLDPSFSPVFAGVFPSDVCGVIEQADGRIVVCGGFTMVNGVPRNQIARLNADGTLDPLFSPVFVDQNNGLSLRTLVLQSDGKILVCGYFTSIDGVSRSGIVRLMADGSIDPNFGAGSGPNGAVKALAVQSDGKLVIAGGFTAVGDVARAGIARLNADGSLDLSFAPGNGVSGTPEVLALRPDGRIYLGGFLSSYNGAARKGVVLISPDGSLDLTFDASGLGDFSVTSLAVLSDGRLALAGHIGEPVGSFAVLSSTGSLDGSYVFPVGTSGTVATVAVGEANRIFAGGFSADLGSALQTGVARYESNGALSLVAAAGFRSPKLPACCVPVSGGRWLVGGEFTHVNGAKLGYLARLNNEGATDPTFDASSAVTSPVQALAIQGDGAILVLGGVAEHIARLQPDGARDSSFNVGTGFGSAPGNQIQLLPDGRVVVAGGVASYRGENNSNLVIVIKPDGLRDPTFSPSESFFGSVRALVIEADGRIATGGYLYGMSTGSTNLVRWDRFGAKTFPPDSGQGPDGWIYGLGIDPLGRLLVTGQFQSFSGSPRGGFARVNADGSLFASLNTSFGFGYWARWLLPQADGKVLVGGYFSSFNGVRCRGLVRLDAQDGLDEGFAVFDSTSSGAVSYADDGRLLLTCGFGNRGGLSRFGLVMLKPDVAPVPLVITTQPVSRQLNGGDSLELSVTAVGAPPLTYQWYRDGVAIGGATDRVMSLSHPSASDLGRYQVIVSSDGDSVVSSIALVTGGTMTLADWAAQGGVPANQRGALDTPAGDGVTNLMKFALGVPPLESATAHLPTATTYTQAGQPLAIALLFTRNSGAQGIDYLLEVSDNMVTWTEVARVIEVLDTNPDGTQLVRMFEAVPPVAVRRFARLKVEIVP